MAQKTMLQSGGGVRTLPLAIGGGGMFVKTTAASVFNRPFLNQKDSAPGFQHSREAEGTNLPSLNGIPRDEMI
jgi:hypothetical protein